MTSKFATFTAGLALAVSLFSIGAAHAVPAPMHSICSLSQFECADGGRDIVTSTPQLLDLVRSVNRPTAFQINITADHQSLKSTYGDCSACALPSVVYSSFG